MGGLQGMQQQMGSMMGEGGAAYAPVRRGPNDHQVQLEAQDRGILHL